MQGTRESLSAGERAPMDTRGPPRGTHICELTRPLQPLTHTAGPDFLQSSLPGRPRGMRRRHRCFSFRGCESYRDLRSLLSRPGFYTSTFPRIREPWRLRHGNQSPPTGNLRTKEDKNPSPAQRQGTFIPARANIPGQVGGIPAATAQDGCPW